MAIQSLVEGLTTIQATSLGHPDLRIAILDGPVDLGHPCFDGANLTSLDAPESESVDGQMARHGTHVTSLIFGQPGSSVVGIAPACSGVIIPVLRGAGRRVPQLDLARAIERAVEAGANLINVSGGEWSPTGEADATLQHAIDLADKENVLVIAAAGNDGCQCVHVPAALPSVLAVGALDRAGQPLVSSNWGDHYRSNGVLAPGERIPGAAPGGGTVSLTGTSFATPIVAGIAALLLSQQRTVHGIVDPRMVAEAILRTRSMCLPSAAPECERFVGGVLDVPKALAYVESRGEKAVPDSSTAQVRNPEPDATVHPSASNGAATAPTEPTTHTASEAASSNPADSATEAVTDISAPSTLSGARASAISECGCRGVTTSADCQCDTDNASFVYALGSIGFDYGTEARRDTFRQLMPDVVRADPRSDDGAEDSTPIRVSANPHDVFQLYDYLESRPYECTKLIWTINLDLTPIYAVEAENAYPEDIYKPLRDALRFQALPLDDRDFVARVSIPGRVTKRTVQLFSGQVLPVVVAQPRGLYMWNETLLVQSVVDAVSRDRSDVDTDYVSKLVRTFLDKVYFQCRNLGQSPPDRALNFAATNAYQVASSIAAGLLSGNMVPGAEDELYTLDTIDVSKSPYCRFDSDCWDVRITFFDPVNDRRAKSVYQFTIDVSDVLPVSLAPAHQYLAT